MPDDALFQPLTINKLSLAGRLFKSATSESRANRDGQVGDEYLAFYEPMARAGTPLIITGNLYISRDGQSTARMAGVDDDDKLPGLRRLTDTVHAHGSRVFAQLNHCGRQVIPSTVGLREAVLRRLGFRLTWPLLTLLFNILCSRREGCNLAYAHAFKMRLSIPVICVGGFLHRERMQAAILDGLCDAVSSARAFIADPYLYRHLREGRSAPACVYCNACVGRIGAEPVDCYHPLVRRAKDAMLADD